MFDQIHYVLVYITLFCPLYMLTPNYKGQIIVTLFTKDGVAKLK